MERKVYQRRLWQCSNCDYTISNKPTRELFRKLGYRPGRCPSCKVQGSEFHLTFRRRSELVSAGDTEIENRRVPKLNERGRIVRDEEGNRVTRPLTASEISDLKSRRDNTRAVLEATSVHIAQPPEFDAEGKPKKLPFVTRAAMSEDSLVDITERVGADGEIVPLSEQDDPPDRARFEV